MFPPWTTPEAAAEILKNGGVVAIPTETVYGLAGNAYDPKALAKIFEAKKRPHFDPLIVHISAIEELSNVALEVPAVAKKLAKAYWPGPMTLVLPKKDCIPDLATSGLPTVAVRFPNHPIAQKIIRLAGVPLAAPSANLFQHVSPTTAQHICKAMILLSQQGYNVNDKVNLYVTSRISAKKGNLLINEDFESLIKLHNI